MGSSSDHNQWWRAAVIYEIYVRSFADSDGDGYGDLAGIRGRLDDLVSLGVDAVWLTPFYPSPQADAGYDVADYRDVDRLFGTLEDLDRLIDDVHGGSMKMIVDIVPNHTSSKHPWFQQALVASPGSAERARYIFRDGAGATGDDPPNNWTSEFGGSAWSRAVDAGGSPEQWYLHMFAPEQPDLNWANDDVRIEFDDVLRFWLDRGVDGFRIDVAHGLMKDPALPDDAPPNVRPQWDQEGVHDIYRRWRKIIDAYPGDRVFCGEVWLDRPRRVARYLRADELQTAFNFHFLRARWSASAMRQVIDETIDALADVGATPTWVLSNHDVVRAVTRYGGGADGVRRARAAALLMLALPGAAYLYQGEELGLPEVEDLPDAARQDPTFRRTAGAQRGRDGCRVPIPWAGDGPSYDFGPTSQSWLPQPETWKVLAWAQQRQDQTSTLTLYRSALRLRKELPALGAGELHWLDASPDVLAFGREPGFTCVVNFGDRPVDVRPIVGDAVALLASSITAVSDGRLEVDGAVWFRRAAE